MEEKLKTIFIYTKYLYDIVSDVFACYKEIIKFKQAILLQYFISVFEIGRDGLALSSLGWVGRCSTSDS